MLTKSRARDIIAWTLLLGVVVFSVVRTQETNNNLADLTAQMARSSQCTEDFLARTVSVANDRTELNPELNKASADRVRAEGRLFGFLVQVNGSLKNGEDPSQAAIAHYRKLVQAYFDAIQDYLVVLGRSDISQQNNPFPTSEEYNSCLRNSK